MASGKEKKRKREQDATARPKKRVAIQAVSQSAQSNTIKIASVNLDSSCPPVIGERAPSLAYTSSFAHYSSDTSRPWSSQLRQISSIHEASAIEFKTKAKQTCCALLISSPIALLPRQTGLYSKGRGTRRSGITSQALHRRIRPRDGRAVSCRGQENGSPRCCSIATARCRGPTRQDGIEGMYPLFTCHA